MTDIFKNCWSRGRGILPFRAIVLLFSLIMAMYLSGCAGTTPSALSSSQLEAIRHNQRGIRAESRGQHSQALGEFSESYRIYRSIEYSEGIIVSLVNSSRVLRQSGNVDAAREKLNSAVPLVTPESPLYSEFAFEMAQVLLADGDPNQAATWASQAVTAEIGVQRGRRVNLLARLRYLQGNMAVAEKLAREALLLNRENGAREEEANSHRTLGDILAPGSRNSEAAGQYSQALAIDKDLGKSRKIAADLRGFAHLYQVQSDLDRALVYYRRAVDVSDAVGDRSGAADDLVKMSRIHEQRGEKEKAERLLIEREQMLKYVRTP